jgi:hypothetical protein
VGEGVGEGSGVGSTGVDVSTGVPGGVGDSYPAMPGPTAGL